MMWGLAAWLPNAPPLGMLKRPPSLRSVCDAATRTEMASDVTAGSIGGEVFEGKEFFVPSLLG